MATMARFNFKLPKFLRRNKDSIRNIGRKALMTLGSNWASIIGSIGGKFEFKRKDDNTLMNEGYVSNTDVYSIIGRICDNLGDVPKIVIETKDDEKIIVTDGILASSIVQVNPRQTISDYMFDAGVNYLSTGDLFIWPIVPPGFDEVTEWNILQSIAVEVKINNRNEVIGYWYYPGGNRIVKYDVDEIIHIKNTDPSAFGIESHRGLSTLQAAYMTLSSSNDNQAAEASILKNNAVSGILSDKSGAVLDPTDKGRSDEKLEEEIGGAFKKNKILARTGDYQFTQIGMSPVDLKHLDNDVRKLRKLCSAFNVDSSLFNDPEAKSKHNRKESMKAMFHDAVIPLDQKILRGMNGFLIQNELTDKRIDSDYSNIDALQEDKVKQAAKNKIQSEGVTNILKLVSSNEVSRESAVIILIDVWGIPEKRALEIVK